MKLLILTSEPITADHLQRLVPGELDASDTEVMVVAPALQESPIKFWFSDADEAIQRASRVSSETVEKLDAAGVSASGDTGESDPLQAIEDALATFPADRIVVFAADDGQHYREDVDVDLARERFGVPVERATISD
jgi:hypothetical protein